MRKKIITIAAAAIMATVPLVASNNGNLHQRGAHQFGKMIRSLDLSSAQKEQLKALRADFKRQMVRSHRMSALREAMDERGFNKSVFIEHAQQKCDIRLKRRADRIEKMYAILTPSQRIRLMQMLDDSAH